MFETGLELVYAGIVLICDSELIGQRVIAGLESVEKIGVLSVLFVHFGKRLRLARKFYGVDIIELSNGKLYIVERGNALVYVCQLRLGIIINAECIAAELCLSCLDRCKALAQILDLGTRLGKVGEVDKLLRR